MFRRTQCNCPIFITRHSVDVFDHEVNFERSPLIPSLSSSLDSGNICTSWIYPYRTLYQKPSVDEVIAHMKTLIKNGRIITAVDDYRADILVDGEIISTIGLDLDVHADRVIDAQNQL